jgi:CO/xanthine dehydrogenase FAD-binding subunit
MAAALMEWDDEGTLAKASIAVGSASPVASRLNKLEQDLVGLQSGTRPSSILDASHLQPLSPIDDVRATAVYRLDAGLSVIGQALDAAWERSVHEQ